MWLPGREIFTTSINSKDLPAWAKDTMQSGAESLEMVGQPRGKQRVSGHGSFFYGATPLPYHASSRGPLAKAQLHRTAEPIATLLTTLQITAFSAADRLQGHNPGRARFCHPAENRGTLPRASSIRLALLQRESSQVPRALDQKIKTGVPRSLSCLSRLSILFEEKNMSARCTRSKH